MNRNLFRWVAPIIFISIVICFYIAVLQSETLARSFLGSVISEQDSALDVVSKFGDTSGFINALFSALAFGGVILTFYWQFMVDGKQQKATLQSQFENVFFNMTNTLENIIDGLSVIPTEITDVPTNIVGGNNPAPDNTTPHPIGVPDNRIQGRQVFKYWFDYYLSLAQGADNKIAIFHDMMKGSLDHYFRYLYRILVYIDQSDLVTESEKYDYAAILRAQLSEYELLILFFNGLTDKGKHKAKPLFEKYSLFNNLRTDELVNLGTIAQYRQSSDEPSSDTKYASNAFEHSYSSGSHTLRFFARLLFVSVAIIAVYELISNLWDNYVIQLVLAKIPSDNIWIEILCALVPLYIYCHRYYEKRKFNGLQLQKRYGSVQQDERRRYLPFSVLLDREYNTIALSAFILLVYVTFFHSSTLPWSWFGAPIPYVVLLGVSLFADILTSALFVKWVGVNCETFLDWLSSVLVPGANSIRQWWRALTRRYERLNGNNQTPSANVAFVAVTQAATSQQEAPAASPVTETNEEDGEPIESEETQEPPAAAPPVAAAASPEEEERADGDEGTQETTETQEPPSATPPVVETATPEEEASIEMEEEIRE